jgi:hypothetical protein
VAALKEETPTGSGDMTWYVAIVAIVNLALGYALAVFMGTGRERVAVSTGELDSNSGDWES